MISFLAMDATDRDAILEDELRVKEWKDYEVVEHDELGGLFLDKVWRRNLVSGEWEVTPLRFRVPDSRELRAQRVLARQIAVEEGLDPEKDPVVFDDLDTACVLHVALRDVSEPYEPFAMDPRDLERRLGKARMLQAWKKLEQYRQLLNPEPANITPEQMAALSAVIVQERSIRPLVVFDSLSQASYMLTLAELHVTSLLARSSRESSEPSTPEP